MPTTKLLFSQLRLLHLSSSLTVNMKPPTTATPFRSLPSRTFSFFPFKFKHLALRNAPFRTLRPFSSARSEFTRRRGEKARLSSSSNNPRSLVDDEAELSDWVDELKTARVDSDFGESTRNRSRPSRDPGNSFSRNSRFSRRFNRELEYKDDDGDDSFAESTRNRRQTRDPVNSFSRNSRFTQRFNRELEDEDGELRTRKRRGGELRRGGGKSAKRRPQLRSDDDDDDEVVGRGLKGFLSEEGDEEEEEGGEGSEADEIVKKSRSALFGGGTQQPAPRAASPGGSDSYLSATRYVNVFLFFKKNLFFFLLLLGLAYLS